MITDQGLRLATAEAINLQNAGVLGAPTLGQDSVALALDESGLTNAIRAMRDVGAGHRMSLAINCDVSPITGAGFDTTLEIQLVSMPILATKLTAATTEGRLHSLALVVTDVAGHTEGEDVFLFADHGLALGTPIHLSSLVNTTGIAVDRVYYVIPTGTGTFQVATTLANAIAGTQVAMTGTDGTATVKFIATVHATTGTIRLFDEIGTAVHGGQLVVGNRLIVPLRPLTARTSKQSVPAGQTISQPYGVGPDLNLVGVTPQRFYYLNYRASATITGGAITCDLVLGSGEGDALTFMPTAVEVKG